MSYGKNTSKEYSEKAKRLFPKPWLGYRKKKCKVCKTPFVLGPLDPNMDVCPLHTFKVVAEKFLPSSEDELKRMLKYAEEQEAYVFTPGDRELWKNQVSRIKRELEKDRH